MGYLTNYFPELAPLPECPEDCYDHGAEAHIEMAINRDREALLREALEGARTELAALKARRCDGCAHHRQCVPEAAYVECTLWVAGRRHAEPILVPLDHACNAWQPRP